MEHYAGIDVSLERSSVCVVDATGRIVREAKVASEPGALVRFFRELGLPLARVGLEAGPLSQWLHAGLTGAGFEAVLLETRHVKAALSAMIVKTDRKDARGIAQLLRMGWYRPVHRKSPPAQEVRALLVGRKLLQAKLLDVELSIRGILRGFGLKLGEVGKGRFAARVRELAPGQPMLERVVERKRRPTAAIIDTQSVKTGPQRGPRGYDAGKKVKGRKRVLLVDVEGDPLGVRVVPADVHEHRALLALAPDLAAHPSLRLAWLDRGFAGDEPEAFLNRHGIAVEVVGIRNRAGFQLEKRRWKAEQTFGCLQRYRRLRVDDEMSCETSRGMAMLAALFMTGMRLERLVAS